MSINRGMDKEHVYCYEHKGEGISLSYSFAWIYAQEWDCRIIQRVAKVSDVLLTIEWLQST